MDVSIIVDVKLGKLFNPNFTLEKSKKLIAKFDLNNDGKIDLQEFLCFFGNYLPTLAPEKARTVVEQLLLRPKAT